MSLHCRFERTLEGGRASVALEADADGKVWLFDGYSGENVGPLTDADLEWLVTEAIPGVRDWLRALP